MEMTGAGSGRQFRLITHQSFLLQLLKSCQGPLLKQRSLDKQLPSLVEISEEFLKYVDTKVDQEQITESGEGLLKEDIYKWSLESITYLSLNVRLNCINDHPSEDAVKMIQSVQAMNIEEWDHILFCYLLQCSEAGK